MRRILLMALAAVLLVSCEGSDGRTTALLEELRQMNQTHYAIGCIYDSYSAAMADEWLENPPIPPPEGQRYWAGGYATFTWLTLFDLSSDPTNATRFSKVHDGKRTCYFPIP
jgi:hypothetical protein